MLGALRQEPSSARSSDKLAPTDMSRTEPGPAGPDAKGSSDSKGSPDPKGSPDSKGSDKDPMGRDGPDEELGLIGRFLRQYDNENTRRLYRTDLEKLERFLAESRGTGVHGAGESVEARVPEDARREELLQFLRAESTSVGRATLRRRATALKLFFDWLEAEGHADSRPIGSDESVSSLVDTVLEENSGREENPGREESPVGEEKSNKEESSNREEDPGGEEDPKEEDGPSKEENPSEEKNPSGTVGQRKESGKIKTRASSEGPLDIPHWVRAAAEEKGEEITLSPHGKSVPLPEVPGAILQGLSELAKWMGDPYWYNYIRLTSGDEDLTVQIEQSQDPLRIEVRIEHDVIQRIAGRGPDSLRSYHTVPKRALWYFRGRGWSMPRAPYKLVGFSHAGGVSETDPTWRSTSSDLTGAQFQAAIEVTGALTKAFGIGKEEKVLISLGP